MGTFRKWVIGIAEAVLVATIVVCTLLGAIVGFGGGAAMGSGGGPSVGLAIVGLAIGAVLGFAVPAVASAMFFTLAETAENSRKMVGLLQLQITAGLRAPGQATPSYETSRYASPPPGERPMRPAKVGARGFDISAEATAILNKAREKGIITEWQADGTLVIMKGDSKYYCRSDRDVIDLASSLAG